MISGNTIAMMGIKTGLLLLIIMAAIIGASHQVTAATGYATAADLKPIRSNMLIFTRQHFCLTVKKAGVNKVAKVQFSPCHGRLSQRWNLSKGGYLIHFGKRLRQCLSVPENLLRIGTALRLSDCKNVVGQRWFYKKNRLFLFMPKQTLCVTSRKVRQIRRGSAAVLGSCISKKGTTINFSSKLPLPVKPVQLKVKKSGRCIDKTENLKNGVNLQAEKCLRKNAQQRFKLEKQRGEDIQIQSVDSGKCLSIENASKKPGAPAQQWSCLGYDNQLWKKIDYPQGWFALKAKHSGFCLTLIRQNKQKRTYFQQNRCKGGRAAHQLFKMIQ